MRLVGIDTGRRISARLRTYVLEKGRLKETEIKLHHGDDLFAKTGRELHQHGYKVTEINAGKGFITFENGKRLILGEFIGPERADIFRAQIRETLRQHMLMQENVRSREVKVLSLFFIDTVVKYRDYDQEDNNGEYARVFEREYDLLKEEYLSELAIDNEAYRKYLADIETQKTHNGYFAIDKKGKLQEPKVSQRGSDKGLATDVDAYDLILKDKERLLSFDEPTRFIFSHSALREGWDNPNVFVMCMLKHSDNTLSRRQEVGRGLRLSVNQHGERMDHPAIVHDINVLTVVASESYKDFVAGLQTECCVWELKRRPKYWNRILAGDDFFAEQFSKSQD